MSPLLATAALPLREYLPTLNTTPPCCVPCFSPKSEYEKAKKKKVHTPKSSPSFRVALSLRSIFFEPRFATFFQFCRARPCLSPPFEMKFKPSNRFAQRLSLRPVSRHRSYAFIEFRSERDAEEAYHDMYVCILFRFRGPFIASF